MTVRLTLVSASPRRRDLLQQLGVPFDVRPSHASECWTAESPSALAVANSVRKAKKSECASDSDRILLAADTIIALDRDIFGKPAGPDAAFRMLTRLSGRWHQVVTGYCLINGSFENIVAEAVSSEVRFYELPPQVIKHYVDSSEWHGKAGAYAIQGLAGEFVAELRGARDNVIGLPVEAIKESLGRHFSNCKFL